MIEYRPFALADMLDWDLRFPNKELVEKAFGTLAQQGGRWLAVYLDGEPLFAAGMLGDAKEAQVCFAVTTLADRHPKTFHAAVRNLWRTHGKHVKKLSALVRKEHATGLRWAARFGFRPVEEIEFMGDSYMRV
ncbi:hypothetical protein, partial [Photobacterium phosphoreum]|uniref:hypothetical protein n=1 Tax=Photobacterium phosphoreum TaxID=659 RepID=UPI0024B6E75B